MRSGETDCFNSSKTAFTSAPTKGMNPSRKFFTQRFLQSRRTGEKRAPRRASASLGPARTEHYPVKHAIGILLRQAKDGAATANLDIVGMRAQTKDL